MMAGRIKAGVQLNRTPANYWPGEIISGHLFIQTVNSPQSISQLKLRLYGAAKILLERRDWLAKRHYRYNQTEVYVEKERAVQDLTVVPHPDTMTRGVHVFEFQLMLPSGIPPSLKGRHGDIEYTLCVYTLSPRRKPTALCTLPIAVVSSLDLTKIRAAQEMVYREVESVSGGCLSDTRHDIQVKAWLEKGGCFRGENIPLHVEINNNSDVRIKRTKLKMKKTHIYHSMGETEILVSRVPNFRPMTGQGIAPRTRVTWNLQGTGLALPPDIAITGPPGCSVIDVSYELIVKVYPAGCVNNVKISLPLIVGAAMPAEVQREVERNAETCRANAAALLLAMLGEAARRA